jgi:ribonuclease HII
MAKLLSSYFDDHRIEVGCDEVGRGALAGPVVAAAVIWNPDTCLENNDDATWKLIRDSKKVSVARRGMLSDYIKDNAVDFAIQEISAHEIDEINILQATMKAIHKALDDISVEFDHIIVDGDKFKPYMPCNGSGATGFIPHTCVVKGDDKYLSIAAASILAKVSRDDTMCHLHPEHQVYNWMENKGYGTRAHFEAIHEHGSVEGLHRQTFLKKSLATK